MFHVVLYRPQIPPNTGSIIRLCANTGATLHLVQPLGFALDRKSVRRAGLDYAELACVQVHANLDRCRAALAGAPLYLLETDGTVSYAQAQFAPGAAFVFGPETTGMPAALARHWPPQQRLYVPMRPGNRSMNLANTVALVLYEAWRQNGISGAGPVAADASAGRATRAPGGSAAT